MRDVISSELMTKNGLQKNEAISNCSNVEFWKCASITFNVLKMALLQYLKLFAYFILIFFSILCFQEMINFETSVAIRSNALHGN